VSDEVDLFELLEDLEREHPEKEVFSPIKAPFSWAGGKSRSIKYIIPHLPTRDIYCEPFGGSAAVLLARSPSKLDIFNDAYAGVVAFYRCMRDPVLFNRLIDWLDLTVNAKEEFYESKKTWENYDDPVERAGRWYYITVYSFGSLGRNWGSGRNGSSSSVNGRIIGKLKEFPEIHSRFRKVQVENLDGIECMKRYDAAQAVFYLDPPYVDCDPGIYKHKTDHSYHRRLLDTIFEVDGFVAISGFPNPLYDERPWDKVFQWDVFHSVSGTVETPATKDIHSQLKRDTAKEKLWIKEGRFFK
jgi:DNA adenine methylase